MCTLTLVGFQRMKEHSPSSNPLPPISFQVGRSLLLRKINYSGIYCSSSESHGQGGNARNLFDFVSKSTASLIIFRSMLQALCYCWLCCVQAVLPGVFVVLCTSVCQTPQGVFLQGIICTRVFCPSMIITTSYYGTRVP